MEECFPLNRQHGLMLCDAALAKAIKQTDLTTLAFVLIASDRFEWEDEILREVLSDWSCPEINLPLNTTTLEMHRDWLTGSSAPPLRPVLARQQGRLILSRYVKKKRE
jgi:hypothetical protein